MDSPGINGVQLAYSENIPLQCTCTCMYVRVIELATSEIFPVRCYSKFEEAIVVVGN